MKPVLEHVIRPIPGRHLLEHTLGQMPGHAPSNVLKHMHARYAT